MVASNERARAVKLCCIHVHPKIWYAKCWPLAISPSDNPPTVSLSSYPGLRLCESASMALGECFHGTVAAWQEVPAYSPNVACINTWTNCTHTTTRLTNLRRNQL